MSGCVIRQLPLLDSLAKASPAKRKKILKAANFDLIKSIIECIENVLKGNVKLKKKFLTKLKKYKTVLHRILNSGKKWTHKKKVIIQSGGAFLPTLLAPVVGLLVDRLLLSR